MNNALEPGNQQIFKIKKFESLAFQKLVNHSRLCGCECLHPFEQKNSDQKGQNKAYRLIFWRKFSKIAVVKHKIFSFVKK